MGIVLRKLIYNETDIHLITWNGKPCFIVSELSKALDGVNKEDISLFLRHNAESLKGEDYDVLQDADSRRLRSCLEECGVVKRFAKAMVIYYSGLHKYFDFRRTVPVKDFAAYLAKSKVDVYEPAPVPAAAAVTTTAATPAQSTPKETAPGYKGYSEFLKHIAFMEEFVKTINSLNISPDKSIAFTVDMTKFLEDNGVQPQKLLTQMKKWIV
jgi:hypothetical protein